MWLHGMGNFGILLAGAGLAAWRSSHRASALTAALGVGAVGAAIYTAWLGGELVYTHGAGVVRLGGLAAEAPALFSRHAPGRLARDAGRGLAWLLRRGRQAITGRQRVDRAALGPIAEAGSMPASH